MLVKGWKGATFRVCLHINTRFVLTQHTQHVVLMLLTTDLLPVYGVFLFKSPQSLLPFCTCHSLNGDGACFSLYYHNHANGWSSYAPIVWRYMKYAPVAWVFYHIHTSPLPFHPLLLLSLKYYSYLLCFIDRRTAVILISCDIKQNCPFPFNVSCHLLLYIVQYWHIVGYGLILFAWIRQLMYMSRRLTLVYLD